MEKQRKMEESRNKAALDRALAPPYRPEGRRPVFRYRHFKLIIIQLFHLDQSLWRKKVDNKLGNNPKSNKNY